jgi:hypothetical protein
MAVTIGLGQRREVQIRPNKATKLRDTIVSAVYWHHVIHSINQNETFHRHYPVQPRTFF